MKCAKSRNSKNRRSSSGSLGTVPGWRAASSETIRGDAEPTWWTCSSALGRPAMKSARASRPAVCHRTCHCSCVDQVLGDLVHGPAVLEDLAVEQDRRGALDAGVLGGLGRVGDPAACRPRSRCASRTSASSAPASTARSTRSSSSGNGPDSLGWFSKSRSWNFLATSGPDSLEHDRERAGRALGVVADPAEQVERAVLDLHLAVRRRAAVRSSRRAPSRTRRRRGRGSPRRRRPRAARRPARWSARTRCRPPAPRRRRWCRAPGRAKKPPTTITSSAATTPPIIMVRRRRSCALLLLERGGGARGAVGGAVLLRHHDPSGAVGAAPNSRASRDSLVEGSQTRKSEASRSTASRAISQGYFDGGVGVVAAAAEAAAVDVHAAGPDRGDADDEQREQHRRDDGRAAGQQAQDEHQRRPRPRSTGSSWPTGCDERAGQQLVGADGGDGLGRVEQLGGAGVQPDATHDEARDETDPLLHGPDPRALSLNRD